MPNAAPDSTTSTRFHLPDFCSGGAVLAIVLIVELLSLILTLARQPFHNAFWVDLAGTSLFLLWQGLGCAAILCRLRRWLQTQPAPYAYLFTLGALVVTSAIIAEAVVWLSTQWPGGPDGMPTLFPRDHGWFLLRTLAVSFIVSALALRYFHVAAEWKRSVELESQARVRALQARIRPHFLFNSMNTIAALTRSDPERAEEAVEDLADLFRANLNEARGHIPLKEELEIARIYQRIEQLRLGDRLKVVWDVVELPMRAMVPSLLVQPLLENAIYHGIEALPEGGTVTVSGKLDDDQIELSVSNPVAAKASRQDRNGNKIALDNIQQRLALAWPGKSAVRVMQNDDRYTISLSFPYQDRAD